MRYWRDKLLACVMLFLQENKTEDTKQCFYLNQSMDQRFDIPPIILADANIYVWQLRGVLLHNTWWRHQMETFYA